jgi:phage terminase large subunit-like protein
MITIRADELIRIVIGVDPAMTSGENADETGIIVAASGPHQPDTCALEHCTIHGYILEDATIPKGTKATPERWATRVVDAFDEWNAGLVVVESNAGHELLEMTLRTIRPTLPVSRPNAGENKRARAEPIVALYEQGRVHHIGDPTKFAALEEQMTTWVPPAPGQRSRNSPDRLDALVWALTELNLQGRKPRKSVPDVMPIGLPQQNVWKTPF